MDGLDRFIDWFNRVIWSIYCSLVDRIVIAWTRSSVGADFNRRNILTSIRLDQITFLSQCNAREIRVGFPGRGGVQAQTSLHNKKKSVPHPAPRGAQRIEPTVFGFEFRLPNHRATSLDFLTRILKKTRKRWLIFYLRLKAVYSLIETKEISREEYLPFLWISRCSLPLYDLWFRETNQICPAPPAQQRNWRVTDARTAKTRETQNTKTTHGHKQCLGRSSANVGRCVITTNNQFIF